MRSTRPRSLPPTSRATRSVSTIRSPTGSARSSLSRSRQALNRPVERYSAANRANGGRSTSGPRVDSADSASGSDMPGAHGRGEVVDDLRPHLAQVGLPPAGQPAHLRVGQREAEQPEHQADGDRAGGEQDDDRSDQQPEPDLQGEQLGGVDAGQPGRGQRAAAAGPAGAGRCAAAGARGPLRQISSSPTPRSSPSSAPDSVTSCPSAEQGGEVEAERGEPVGVRRIAVGADQPAVAGGEDVGGLDDAALGAAGQRDDLAHPAVPGRVGADVHDQVDAGGHGRDDERRPDVLAGQQRQRAHLHHGLAGAVGVQRAHAGQPGVQRDQQVEALLLPHLADDDPGGPHPQRLLDQAAQRDLAGALEVGLAGLHRDDVGQRHPQLEDLLAGDDPLPRRDGRARGS